ncbi:hypothetical protein CERZMDRAFT_82595 [Cercospora zeae-maydis SCOH1-5]|uniref:asparaginase n=1 Tax=Cercospora zeae-maydis SCOH1-5 TaxID=717836 RepID=A0A6A6FMK0_9PEZI|nr:hypothetical protein CERZMDRAFT_82595 [Cercospora zeae-maydis SCOH1-5]
MAGNSKLLLTLATALLATSFPLSNIADRAITYDFSSSLNSSLPNVTIFATGGTIASQGNSNTQTVGYSVGLGVQDLVDAVPELLDISNVNGFQVSNVGSGSINSSVLLNLAEMITEEFSKPDISGVVVTHGTDSLEETAFFLDLVIDSPKPIVVVGAMRPATALSADGPLNLYQAVTLATSANAIGRGTLISLNDRIGSAFYTTKNNANSLDTFYSTEAGQLGTYIDQVPYFYFAPARPIGRTYFNTSGLSSLPQVDILYAHQEMDSNLALLAVAAGAKGLVFAGMGAGSLSGAASVAAESTFSSTQVPIVASHRSSDGFVPADEDDFIIGSGFYNPQKTRVLLRLALAKGYSLDEIREVYCERRGACSYHTPDLSQSCVFKSPSIVRSQFNSLSILERGVREEKGVLEVVDLGSFSADFFAYAEKGWATFAEVVLLSTIEARSVAGCSATRVMVIGPRRHRAKRYTEFRSSPGRSRKVVFDLESGNCDIRECLSEALISCSCGSGDMSAFAWRLMMANRNGSNGKVEEEE